VQPDLLDCRALQCGHSGGRPEGRQQQRGLAQLGAAPALPVRPVGVTGDRAQLGGERTLALKPMTFMNESSKAVGEAVRFLKIPLDRVVVFHDELDIDFGQIRLKLGGGEGGHNGLRSVANALGTKDFQRVRIGIGRPPGREDPAAFVLENFTATERPEVPTICEQAADATELLIELGLEAAQNRVHAW